MTLNLSYNQSLRLSWRPCRCPGSLVTARNPHHPLAAFLDRTAAVQSVPPLGRSPVFPSQAELQPAEIDGDKWERSCVIGYSYKTEAYPI